MNREEEVTQMRRYVVTAAREEGETLLAVVAESEEAAVALAAAEHGGADAYEVGVVGAAENPETSAGVVATASGREEPCPEAYGVFAAWALEEAPAACDACVEAGAPLPGHSSCEEVCPAQVELEEAGYLTRHLTAAGWEWKLAPEWYDDAERIGFAASAS